MQLQDGLLQAQGVQLAREHHPGRVQGTVRGPLQGHPERILYQRFFADHPHRGPRSCRGSFRTRSWNRHP